MNREWFARTKLIRELGGWGIRIGVVTLVSAPSFLFVVAKNMPASNFWWECACNVNIITAMKMMLEAALIPTSAQFLSHMCKDHDDDKPAQCRIQLRAMFIFFFTCNIILPIAYTITIDGTRFVD